MKIAVEGCAHGELDNIYDTIKCLEEKEGLKVDLLICCGDFQSSRNEQDLNCMAIPAKYLNICSFYKYYNGEKTAPILTIFIGGNHEASNYLQELPYGGWVAPNIYYLGYAGVINIAGIRIGGLSGIYKGRDYMKGHFESTPYDDSSKRSVYHIRNLEVFRLKQLSQPINIFLSHDWPGGVYNYGNKEQLIRFKPHFREDIENGDLGSKPAEELLNVLKPDYWFSAHLHCKFAAFIPHACGKVTKFLSLDKCLPQRRFLQLLDIPHDLNSDIEISYDLEWLTILKLTNHLLSVKNVMNYLPGPGGQERWCFKPTEDEMQIMQLNLDNNLVIPKNFVKTAPGYVVENSGNIRGNKQPEPVCNPQTTLFCKILAIEDPLQKLKIVFNEISNEDKINETTTTTQARLSLSLPEPKNDSALECVKEANGKISVEKVQEQPIPEECEDQGTSKELSGNDESVTETVEVAGVSAIKKFKRRNAAVYQNDESNS